MSKLQLRSKRRTATPSPSNGLPESEGPSLKKSKNSANVDLSGSESSSDEFVRPSKLLIPNAKSAILRREPSPELDFSCIEKSIFSGVSRLSESESDDSEFEEVPNHLGSACSDRAEKEKCAKFGEMSTKSCALETDVENTFPNNSTSSKSVTSVRIKQQKTSQVKETELKTHNENKVKNSERVTRSSKRKSLIKCVGNEDVSRGKVKRSSKNQGKVKPDENEDVLQSIVQRGTKNKDQMNSDEDEEVAETKVKIGKKKQDRSKSDAKEEISAGRVNRSSKNLDKIKSVQTQANMPSCSRVKTEKAVKESVKNKLRDQDSNSKEQNVMKQKVDVKEEKQSGEKDIPDTVDHLDIAQLLALGEGLKTEGKSSSNLDSESDDWEEVDPNDVKKHEIPKEGVQITLAAPEFSWRRKKHDQQACLQAEMNRAFNRVRRELQLLCHKTSLLLWLAHGIFINRVINQDSVKALALSLVPNDLCKLPKAPGKKYVEQLLTWFLKDFECSEGFPDEVDGHSRPLLAILEHHFSRKFAKSTKELTFMFVTTLRAVGLESRLVISFQPMPLKPQSDELLAINKKTTKSKKGTSACKESRSDSNLDTDQESKVGLETKVNSDSKSPKPASKPRKSMPYKKPDISSGTSSPKKEETKRGKPGRKSAPSLSQSLPKITEKEKEMIRKSETAISNSPVKTREMRRTASKKTYREHSDSEHSVKEEDSQPILSPDRNKSLNKESTERLKAAAAKRVSPNKRSISKSKAATPRTSKSSKARASKSQSQDSDSSDFEPKPKSSSKVSKSPYFSKSASSSLDSDSEFEDKPKKVSKTPSKKGPAKRQPSKGRLSKARDDDAGKKQLTSSGSDYWVEVYLKDEERWTCVDVPLRKVDISKGILAKATQPVCYVVAFNADGTLKDVTKRYSPKFSQVTVKQRVSANWWEKTVKPFRPKQTCREAQEDSEMNMVELDRPMPSSVGECKNHPLYVLKRHLLKFEAIYPPDAPTLGFVRKEAIYARQNVYTLHSREIWMKEAKVVRPGEKPYKIVKARPKYDRLSGKTITDLPLEIFGPWQVEDYVPPPAVDGKVPRNAYGNVELFKPTMLPKGTVHLQVPGLTRVAKKLRIDCAPAVVGFDYHSGGCHPTYDGFVVCEEFVDVLMDAWNKDIDESAKRREEKHEKRIYGNWRRLIKGLLIREALKSRYDFNGENEDVPGSSQSTVNPDVLKASRITSQDGPLPSLFPKLMAKMRSQKSERKTSTTKKGKNAPKTKASSKTQKPKPGRRRKDETSEEEESNWDSSTSEEDDTEMVLLSDEDSGSEFEDLKQ